MAAKRKFPKKPTELTARGERARTKLVEAARFIFDRDGFAQAKITEIAERSAMSVGSFYTYFSTKEEIFHAVLQLVEDEFASPLPREVGTDPLARIEAGNRAYVRNYKQNARILAAMQHRSFEDPELHELRLDARRRWVDRAERAIRRLQADKRVATDVSPRFAAMALSGMVQAYCYEAFAFERKGAEFDEEHVARQLALLWARALGVDVAKGSPSTSKSERPKGEASGSSKTKRRRGRAGDHTR